MVVKINPDCRERPEQSNALCVCRPEQCVVRDGNHKTRCPYKGEASYYHLRLGDTFLENFVWSYPYPKLEALPVAGQLCFFQEKVGCFVDGRKLEEA